VRLSLTGNNNLTLHKNFVKYINDTGLDDLRTDKTAKKYF
jgi:hypothetical protein